MQLNEPGKVATQIQQMQDAERLRAPQRALLDNFFNGMAPWTAEEAKTNRVLINFNNKQGCNLLHQARNQYESAFAKRETFFKVFLSDCDSDNCSDWEDSITKNINVPMKESRSFYYTQDMVWGGIVLHGIGAKLWEDDRKWCPYFAGIQDILIPTDTDLTMDNLQCFAVRRKMRPGELFRKTLARGKNIDPAWNVKMVRTILDEYKDLNQNPNNYDWANHPEQMAELWKQQSGSYYDSDTSPVIWLWDFYHREEGQNEKLEPGWYRKIILDRDCVSGRIGAEDAPLKFLYDRKRPFADSLDKIIHFQFGDGNNVPPFMYHSIRSLAYLTYELLWTMNRLDCQFTQHMFEEMMTFIRVQDPSDRGRLNQVVLNPPFAIIPDGLNIVTANERYRPDASLLSSIQAQYRQQIGDLTSAYTQQLDTGTAKERTKFEVQAILAQTSALMSSMLGRAYRQEHFAYREIARRFCIRNSSDFDVKKFRSKCIADGVPVKWLDYERWSIEVEQVLGNGNRSMELAEATELMSNREAFDPEAQQEIKHDYALAITGNAKKAARLAPLNSNQKITESIHDAQLAFGTLMLGVDMNPREGVNHVEQVAALLGMMAQVVQRITQTDNMGTQQDVIGLQNVAKYIAKHLQIMAGDEKNIPVIKKLGDDLGKLMNLVKAFGQRQQQAKQSNGHDIDPEVIAKIKGMLLTDETKAKLKQASGEQKLQQSEQKFRQNLRHKAADKTLDLQIKAADAIVTAGARRKA